MNNMRKLLFMLFLIPVISQGQVLQQPNTYGYQFRRLVTDSLFALPSDTFNVPVSLRTYPFMARKATTVYLWNTSTFVWAAMAGGGSGQNFGQADTLFSANRYVNQAGYDFAWKNGQVKFGADKEVVGLRYSHNWTSGLTGWTDQSPSATVSTGTGYVEFSGGANDLNNYIESNAAGYISAHQLSKTVTIKPLEKTATSYGMALNFATAGSGSGTVAYFYLSDTAGYITCGNYTTRSVSKFKWSANDTITMTWERSGLKLTLTMANKSNGSTVTLVNPEVHTSVCVPRIHTLGLNFRLIDNFSITYKNIRNPKFIVLGNSIAYGATALSEGTRWQSWAFDGEPGEVVDLSGSSERVQDGWLKVTEIVQWYEPCYVLWCHGVNDRNAGTNLDSVTARISRSFDTLIAHGFTPIGVSATPQTSGDVATYNERLLAECNARGLQYIDVTTILQAASGTAMDATNDWGDGVHLSDKGNEMYGGTVGTELIGSGVITTTGSSIAVANLPLTRKYIFEAVVDYNGKLAKVHRGSDLSSYIKNWGVLDARYKQVGNINIDGTIWAKKIAVGETPQSGGYFSVDEFGITKMSQFQLVNNTFGASPSSLFMFGRNFQWQNNSYVTAESGTIDFRQSGPNSTGHSLVVRTTSSASAGHKYFALVDNVTDTVFQIKRPAFTTSTRVKMAVMDTVSKELVGWQEIPSGGGGGGMTNPMTTSGDIIYGGASGTPTRLAAGTNGHVLTLASGVPTWAASSGGSSGLTVGTSTITSGTNERIGFNDSGVYQEDAGLTYNKTTDKLTVTGDVSAGGSVVLAGSGSSFKVNDRGNPTATAGQIYGGNNIVNMYLSGDVMSWKSGGVGIFQTSPAASAALDIVSTSKGVLLPRMTKTQRDAISSPATGLMIYQTDNTPGLRVYNGTNWMRYTETAD